MIDKSTSLFDLFEHYHSLNKNRETVFFKEYKEYKSITFSELHNKINHTSFFLQRHYLAKKADKIAVIMDNSPLWIISFFSIIKFGAICVPINPHAEKEEILNITNHCKTKLIITTLSLYTNLRKLIPKEIEICAVDAKETKEEIKEIKVEDVYTEINSDDLAAIIYTSGTTSSSKGVMLTHRNFISNIESIRKLNLIEKKDCVIAALPFYHCYALTVTLLTPLLTGAKISFPLYLDSKEIVECINKTKVTIFVGVPRLFELLAKNINQSLNKNNAAKKIALKSAIKTGAILRKTLKINCARKILKPLHEKFGNQLRFMISGGAKLSTDVSEKLYQWGFTILEGYGLTETSPVVTFNTPKNYKKNSVGTAVKNVQVKIVNPDENGKGELAVKGDNVFAGYYKNQAITKKAINNGWFFTNDLATIDKDGFVFIHERKNEVLVLSSGKKLNPEEIETIYSKSPFIEELCVFVPSQNKESLGAVIYPDYEKLRKSGITQIKDRIRWEVEQISHTLPSYKRIKKYTVINEKLARTPLGKLKRYAVKNKYDLHWEKPQQKITPIDKDKELLSHPLCKKAYAYLEEKLEKPFKLDDHLEIDLGLDSLEQIGLLVEFQELTGLDMPDEELFNIFTLRDVFNKLKEIPVEEKPEQKTKSVTLWHKAFSEPIDEKIISSVNLKITTFQKIFNNLLSFFIGLFLKLFFRIKVEGTENIPENESFILCANHVSYLDAPLVYTALGKHKIKGFFLGYKDYVTHPLLNWAKDLLRLIPIEARFDVTESLKICRYILENEKILCMFPEGIRSVDGSIGQLKKGLGILIKELNVKTIPVYLKGAHQAWPPHKKLPRCKKITVIFGKAKSPEQLLEKTRENVDIYKNIVDNLREELVRLQALNKE